MAAITWRNIDAPDLRGSMQGMTLAQRGFQQGLDSLQGILDQQAKTEQANWEQQKRNNTDELKNLLFNAKTPEEAAAIQSQITERLTAMGAQVDANAVRTAADARVPELQRRALEGIDYNNKQTDAKDAPILNRLKALALQDPIAAAAAMNESGLSERGRLALQESLRGITKENVAEDRASTEFGWKGRKFEEDMKMAPLDRAAKQASIASSNASASLSAMRARQLEEEIRNGGTPEQLKARSENMLKTIEASRKEGMAANNWGSDVFTNGIGRKAFDDQLKHIPANEQEDARKELSKFAPKGIEVTYTNAEGKQVKETMPLSADLAILAVNSTEDGMLPNILGAKNRGEAAVKWIKDKFNPKSDSYDPAFAQSYVDGYDLYMRNTPKQRDFPKPGSSTEAPSTKSPPTNVVALPQSVPQVLQGRQKELSQGYGAVYGTGRTQESSPDIPGLAAARLRESMGLPLNPEQRRLLRQYGSGK